MAAVDALLEQASPGQFTNPPGLYVSRLVAPAAPPPVETGASPSGRLARAAAREVDADWRQQYERYVAAAVAAHLATWSPATYAARIDERIATLRADYPEYVGRWGQRPWLETAKAAVEADVQRALRLGVVLGVQTTPRGAGRCLAVKGRAKAWSGSAARASLLSTSGRRDRCILPQGACRS